jgi:hypothetical protein
VNYSSLTRGETAERILFVNRIPGIVFGNVILVSIVGGLPAAFLGVLYGLLVGLQLEKLDPIKYCDVHGV